MEFLSIIRYSSSNCSEFGDHLNWRNIWMGDQLNRGPLLNKWLKGHSSSTLSSLYLHSWYLFNNMRAGYDNLRKMTVWCQHLIPLVPILACPCPCPPCPCPPCPCPPCSWVGEVAWLRGGRWKRRTRMVIEGTLRGPPGPKNSKNINMDIKRYNLEYLLFWIILEKCLKCAMVEAVGGSSLPYYEPRML